MLLLLIAMQCYNSIRNLLSELFSNITNPKACFQVRKIRQPFFSYRSLLLSTSVLNDRLGGQHFVDLHGILGGET